MGAGEEAFADVEGSLVFPTPGYATVFAGYFRRLGWTVPGLGGE